MSTESLHLTLVEMSLAVEGAVSSLKRLSGDGVPCKTASTRHHVGGVRIYHVKSTNRQFTVTDKTPTNTDQSSDDETATDDE